MHLVWVNTHAAPVGGCERMIEGSVRLLADRGVCSTLLYDANCQVEPSFLARFDAAYPLVDPREQLRTLQPDLIYAHQVEQSQLLEALGLQRAPVLRFYHDHRLLHLSDSGEGIMSSAIGGYSLPLIGSVHRGKRGVQFRSLKATQRELRLNRALDAALVGSSYMKEQLLRHGFREQDVHVVPLFAERVPAPSVSRQDGLLLYAGQLVRGKGVDRLIRALHDTCSGAKLAIAGRGSQEKELKQLVQTLGLEPRVEFLGQLPPQELQSWMARARVVVLPHRLPETFALIGPEAMRFGTPVITTALGGVTEWLQDDCNGIAVAPGDRRALTCAIDKLMTDTALWNRLSAGALQSYVERFTPERHIDALLDLIEKMPKPNYNRYTAYGSVEVEVSIDKLCDQIVARVLEYAPKTTRSVVLFGGYGKGEGGVLTIDGVQRPHNNVDILVVTAAADPLLQSTLTKACAPLVEDAKLGIDISVTSESELQNSALSLMWYDMVGGHKTIYGDPSVVLKLPFTDPHAMPAIEMQRLLVNRGSLLVINDWLRTQAEPDQIRAICNKHAVKAVIGYGDALLYYQQRYHWSYERKRSRMRTASDVPKAFRELYEAACAYRLQPDPSVDFEVPRELLAQIFLDCERKRLHLPRMKWNSWHAAALSEAFLRGVSSPRSWGRRLKQLSVHLLDPADRLALRFPNAAFLRFDDSDARNRYLELWGKVADPNFKRFLAAYDITPKEKLSS